MAASDEREKLPKEVPGGMIDRERGRAGGELAAADEGTARSFETGVHAREEEEVAKRAGQTTREGES